MHPKTEKFKQLAQENLADEKQGGILNQFSTVLRALRDAAFMTLPNADAALDKGRRIRDSVVKNLPYLLEMFEERATDAGAKVVWAKDANDANDFIVSLAKEKGGNLCVKGKSMISEELGLREKLIENGIDSYETDLGEFIVQLAGRTPFHIVGPAINMTAEEISDLFVEHIGSDRTVDPFELGGSARGFLREKFKNAGLGITGVNMAVAETGSIILVENEGNIRLSTTAPKTHVAVMSLEKVVPAFSDAVHMLKLLTRSCSGQRISNYVSVITGPRKEGEMDGPEELYIVLLDNGRATIYEDEVLRSSLRCIKCGLCAAVCPIYTHVGGYAYGWVYSGPIGAILNPLLLGLERSTDLYHASTLCGACNDFCPSGVDIHSMLLRLRAMEFRGDRLFKAKRLPVTSKALYGITAWAFSNHMTYGIASKLIRKIMPLLIKEDKVPKHPEKISGWMKCRDLPVLAPQTFRDIYPDLDSERGA